MSINMLKRLCLVVLFLVSSSTAAFAQLSSSCASPPDGYSACAGTGGALAPFAIVTNSKSRITVSETGAVVIAGAVSFTGTVSSSGPLLASDGTSLLPGFAFVTEPSLGFRRSSAAVITLQGSLTATATLSSNGNIIGSNFLFTSSAGVRSPLEGTVTLTNNANTIGVEFKIDALPTVGSGFGSSPAVIAGSTPFAGSVNVGTGGAATTGLITFNGAAFPSAPFCTYSTTTTNAVTRGTPATTGLTLNSTTAWTASDIVTWICVSSK